MFTLLSAYITLETLGVMDHFKEHPKALYSWLWGERGKALHEQSPDNLKSYIIDRTNIKIAAVCVGCTLFLANATLKAFIH